MKEKKKQFMLYVYGERKLLISISSYGKLTYSIFYFKQKKFALLFLELMYNLGNFINIVKKIGPN